MNKLTFGMAFAKTSEGKSILSLRELLIILFTSINAVSFSQNYTNSDFNQVNNIRYGLFNNCDSIWLAEPTRRSPVDAFEDLNVYKANNPDDDCMQIQAKGLARLDFSSRWRNTAVVAKEIEIDTIRAIRCLNVPNFVHDNGSVYIPFSELGMIKVEIDTLNKSQLIYNLKRTKKFAETLYKNLSTPFQLTVFNIEEFENIYQFKIEATEKIQTYIKLIRLDNQEVIYSQKDNNYNKNQVVKITDFDPGQTYSIFNISVNEKNESIITAHPDFSVPEVDIKPLIGFRIYTAWVNDSEKDSTRVKIRTWTTDNCSIQLKVGSQPFELQDYQTDTGINAWDMTNNPYWQHGRWIENLQSNTTYYWQATVQNASGKIIVSSIHSFKTL